MAVASVVLFAIPRFASSDHVADPTTIRAMPANMAAYQDAHDLIGTNLIVDLIETRDSGQEVGADRTPQLVIRGEFSFLADGRKPFQLSPADFAWQVNISPRPIMYLESDVYLADTIVLPWRDDYPTDGSGVTIRPEITQVQAEGHLTRIVVRFFAAFLIHAPIVSQSRTDGHWLQSWKIAWEPSADHLTWLSAEESGDLDWQELSSSDLAEGVHYAGGVQLRVCPTCDIFASYGDAEEIARSEIADAGLDTADDISVEVSTFWRPWESIEAILGFGVATIFTSVAAVIITWIMERRFFVPDD